MDRFTALNVFRHVVELGSFVEASRVLKLSPAAISKNVNELEAYLGVRLLNRTTRKLSLTESGSFYYERVKQVLNDLSDADDVLTDLKQIPKGTLRVSAPVTITLTCLSNQIPKFLERYPEVSLDLQLNDRRVDLIESGFDMVIRGSDNLEDSSLVARKLKVIKHVVCCAPSYLEKHRAPKSPEDLEQHNCVQFSLSDHATEWTFKKEGRTISIPVNGRYKVDSSIAVRDALRNGFGLSLIPLMYVKDDLKAGKLTTVLDDWAPNETTLYAIYPSRRYVVSKVRAFIDFLIDEFDEENS
jgi:DNA-binding transcriptional LysR family regulator